MTIAPGTMPDALGLYGAGLRTGPRSASGPILRLRDGTVLPLSLERWLGPADDTDEQLLDDVGGPVLDVGCGPGRHLHALAARGVFALGVDLSPVAVELAVGRGARAIVGDVFDDLPGGGTWRTALLLDGNIGIGGCPVRLLRRIGGLLSADGEAVVELGAPGGPTDSPLVRIESDAATSAWFRWARVAVDGIDAVARAGELAVADIWSVSERWFARLHR